MFSCLSGGIDFIHFYRMESTTSLPPEQYGRKPKEAKAVPVELVLLIKALLKEPPADHDFATCPLCQKYGITRI
jgi:hypothetical protein